MCMCAFVCEGGRFLSLLDPSPRRQSFRLKLWVGSWVASWGRGRVCNIGSYRAEPQSRGAGVSGREEIIHSALSHPTFCQRTPSSSLPSTEKTLLCSGNHQRGNLLYSKTFSGGQWLRVRCFSEMFCVGGSSQLKGVVQASARRERGG